LLSNSWDISFEKKEQNLQISKNQISQIFTKKFMKKRITIKNQHQNSTQIFWLASVHKKKMSSNFKNDIP